MFRPDHVLSKVVLLLSFVHMFNITGTFSAQSFKLHPRCNGLDDDHDYEMVAFHGSSCVSFFGFASCNYDCGDMGVRLPSSLGAPSRRPLRLVLRAARSLQLEPACLRWVEVQSSARVITVANKSFSSTCRYWLRLVDSQVTGLNAGINDLTILNSDVGFINLPTLDELVIFNSSISTIDHIGLDMYPGTIECSYIQNVFFMNVTAEKLTIKESTFELIGPGSILFNGRTLNITNAYIRKLETKGITMVSGELNIVNTVIEYAAINAIVTEDAKVTMTNVTIKKMDTPGFSFELENDANLSNVTIAGKPLVLRSRLVTLRAQKLQTRRVEDEDIYITGFTDSYCTRLREKLHCNYVGVEKTVAFEQNALSRQYTIRITNSNDLDAEGDFSCNVMDLTSVKGRFISTRTATCPWTGELRAMNTTLDVVAGRTMMAIAINSCTILKMQSISSKRLTVVTSVINDVYSVVSTEQANFEKSNIKRITSLELKSLNIQDCFIDEVVKIILEQDSNDSSVISNTVINRLSPRESIQILSGNLELHNVTIHNAHSGSIYVGPTGSLLLRNVTFVNEIYGLVKTFSRNQVKIEPSSGGTKIFSTLVSVQTLSEGDSEIIPSDALLVGSVSSYCTEETPRSLYCDYSSVENSEVLLSSGEPVVSVSNASSVWIEPTESQIVTLAEVCEVHVVPRKTKPTALFHLDCTNTTILSLTSSIKALSLTSSNVSELYLIPGAPLIYLTTRVNTNINSMAIESNLCMIEQGTIGNVHYLKTKSFLLRESSIVNINENSISITEEANIIDSHIDYIEKHGITALGRMNIRNVSISFAENCSIVVQKFATLELENVVINQGDVTKFFCIIGSIIFLSNVTIGGITFETLDEFNSSYHHYYDDDRKEFEVTSWDDIPRYDSSDVSLETSSKNLTPVFYVGIALGSIASLVFVITGLLIFHLIQKRRRLSNTSGHARWRASSDTVTCVNDDVTEPLIENGDSHEVNQLTADELHHDTETEKSRLLA